MIKKKKKKSKTLFLQPSSLPDYPEVHNKRDEGLFGDVCRLALNLRQLICFLFFFWKRHLTQR